MNFKNLFTALVVLFFVYGKVNGQTVSPWRIHEGNEGVVQFMNAFNGDPRAYDKMKIPAKDDAGWKDAPKDANGNVYLDRSSTLRCLQELDFTYFETTVNIPANMTVNEFKVSYDKADDGARIYFFNSKFPGGTFDPTADLIISQGRDNTGSVNLKDKIAAGDNRVVIVQFDDCADRNSVHNIKIAVNGKQIAPAVASKAQASTIKSDPNGGVTIFEHLNYGGRKCSFGVGSYDITASEYNDIISSIKVMSGWKVTIFEHWKTSGAQVEITSDVADLNTFKFNDIMSGLVVERVSSSAGVNIAKGKQCKASSEAYGGVASRACDGNTNGAFGQNSCTHTKDENDPWWEIDLGSIYDVSKITIWNRTDECCWNRLQGFYVMCSETAITSNSTSAEWQYKGGSCSFNSASQTNLSLDGNKRCRYIRVCIPGSMKVLSLAEVEVFGQVSKNQTATAVTTSSSSKGSAGVNIAKGKQCKASSEAYGGVASRACDGNTNGAFGQNSCTHTNDENDPWWELDLGAIYDVSKINIWNRTDECCWNRLQGFYVMCSETAITSNSTASEWQYKGGSCSFSSASQTNLSLEGNKRCRYVRVCIPGSMKVLSLAEVEVFGQVSKNQTATAVTTSSSSKGSAGGGASISTGKQCKASSVAHGGVASRACDGNTNGAYGQNSCTHTNDENDPWWEVDLGAIYDVSKITIWNRTDECCWNRLQGFYVMCSETAITSNSTASEWQYKGGSCSFSSASQTSLSLDGNKRCRYIRVCIPGNMKVLSLAEVEVFGQLSKEQTASATATAAAATSLPDKFKVLAFSVHEGKQEQDKYWFAINNGGSRGSILSTSKLVNGSKWMEIQRMDLGNNVFAFKVNNAGDDMYLVARDNKEVHIEKAAGGKVPEGAKFKTVAALTSSKGANANNFRSFESVKFAGHFLRHSGYVLFVHTNNNTELFKQDASWLIEKM